MNVCGGAKILGILPSHPKSHAIMTTALMRELATRGHHVTVLSLHPQMDNVGNYTDIVLKTSFMDLLDNGKAYKYTDRKVGRYIGRHIHWQTNGMPDGGTDGHILVYDG
jgi:hypothetical protein